MLSWASYKCHSVPIYWGPSLGPRSILKRNTLLEEGIAAQLPKEEKRRRRMRPGAARDPEWGFGPCTYLLVSVIHSFSLNLYALRNRRLLKSFNHSGLPRQLHRSTPNPQSLVDKLPKFGCLCCTFHERGPCLRSVAKATEVSKE